MTTPNNISKIEFKEFVKEFGFKRTGSTNSFMVGGELYGFSVSSQNTVECRQFSEKYDGLVCMINGSRRWFRKDELVIGAVTRIGVDGTKYHNVTSTIYDKI